MYILKFIFIHNFISDKNVNVTMSFPESCQEVMMRIVMVSWWRALVIRVTGPVWWAIFPSPICLLSMVWTLDWWLSSELWAVVRSVVFPSAPESINTVRREILDECRINASSLNALWREITAVLTVWERLSAWSEDVPVGIISTI